MEQADAQTADIQARDLQISELVSEKASLSENIRTVKETADSHQARVSAQSPLSVFISLKPPV